MYCRVLNQCIPFVYTNQHFMTVLGVGYNDCGSNAST
jgi:hypothetical protein